MHHMSGRQDLHVWRERVCLPPLCAWHVSIGGKLHRMFGRRVLGWCGGERVYHLSCRYDFAEWELGGHCMCIDGLQRRVYWSKRRPVHWLCRWKIQDDQR